MGLFWFFVGIEFSEENGLVIGFKGKKRAED